MSKKKASGIYAFLESSKVLELGTDEEITQARKAYWRRYKAAWRQEKRKQEKEITTSWTDEELKMLCNAAKKHQMSQTKFIKQSTLAYIDKIYIVPDRELLMKALQLLAMTYNQIQEVVEESELGGSLGKEILNRIDTLEIEIRRAFFSPKTLEQILTETIVKDSKAITTITILLQKLPINDTQKS